MAPRDPRSTEDLTLHFVGTYRALRLVLACVAFILPPMLWLGGKLRAGLPLQDSMSAYYHAGEVRTEPVALGVKQEGTAKTKVEEKQVSGEGVMRDAFVGLLFAVGCLLFVYKGYTTKENVALNIAGAFALGVALFPSSWNGIKPPFSFEMGRTIISPHYICAVSLFLCIAFVCIWCAKDTVKLLYDPAKEKRYRMIYKGLGIAMAGSPLLAFLVSGVLQSNDSNIFFLEASAIYVFAAYWVVKSRELRLSKADLKAVRGELEETGNPAQQFVEKP